MELVLKAMFQRVVAYTPVIAKATGSVKLTVLWNQIYYWCDKTTDPEGWVYKSQEDLFDETGLTRKAVDTARALGKKLGIMETMVKGTPPTVHYRVDIDRMVELIAAYLKKHPEKKQKAFKIVPESKERAPKESAIELPAWLNKAAWEEFEQHRKEKKKAMTPLARKKAFAFLEKNQADHVEIINISIRNGWTGLFEIKKPKPSDAQIRTNAKQSVEERERMAVLTAPRVPRTPEEQARINDTLNKMRGGLKNKMKMKL
ncbi:MAG: hypothetical protein WA082_04320 [Candidatus Moraniibacteriota bacterium]